MSSTIAPEARRILVIDDLPAIHGDFRKILARRDQKAAALAAAEAALFGCATDPVTASVSCEVDSAEQGQAGLERVRRAVAEGRPYSVAFVDVRMPPGWDGVETTQHLWQADPHLQVVICTAHSDYSWEDMVARLGQTDQLLILKKPFDTMEVRQLAAALMAKWTLGQLARQRVDRLEQRVRERTKELQRQKDHLEDALVRLQEVHAQLLQADKMASIGQLAAGVAHEINNPIGFISSNLNSLGRYVTDLTRVLKADEQLLLATLRGDPAAKDRAAETEKLRQDVDVAYLLSDIEALVAECVEGTQRVRQIVADLRDFSHIDSPDLADEDINHLLDKTINVCWNELKYKTQVVREYGELPPTRCYGGKLGQVFLNLLVNAAQAIQERGTITVRSGHDGGRVWVEIVDTGYGIPPENLKRIFDPFFTTKDVGKGTGMGLHLAYKIVEAHEGRILASSTIGHGSTFRVEVPVAGPRAAKEVARERRA